MRKTFNKRRKNKNKNRKTKKQMKGGIGDLGEHVFIGYKRWPRSEGFAPIDIPIIVPKNIRGYSSGFFELLFSIKIPSNLLDDVKNYTIYLSQLNKIKSFGKNRFNLYYLIKMGMNFFDSDVRKIDTDYFALNMTDYDTESIDEELTGNHLKIFNLMEECTRLKIGLRFWHGNDLNNFNNFKKEKIKQQLQSPWTEHISITYKVPYWTNNITKKVTWDDPTVKEVEEELKKRTSKELILEFRELNRTKYNEKITELKSILETKQKLRRSIEDLEYRYQGIIEPILLTDEASIYNYANGAEPSVSERIDRTSRVLEEGLKNIKLKK